MDLQGIADRVVAVEQILMEGLIRENDGAVDESDFEPGAASLMSTMASILADPGELNRLELLDMLVVIARMHADEMIGMVITEEDIDNRLGQSGR